MFCFDRDFETFSWDIYANIFSYILPLFSPHSDAWCPCDCSYVTRTACHGLYTGLYCWSFSNNSGFFLHEQNTFQRSSPNLFPSHTAVSSASRVGWAFVLQSKSTAWFTRKPSLFFPLFTTLPVSQVPILLLVGKALRFYPICVEANPDFDIKTTEHGLTG